jgi:hypothetical protein
MAIIRWIVFCVATFVLVALLSRIDSLPDQLAERLQGSPQTHVAAAIKQLTTRDPAAASALQGLDDARRRRAVEAVLRAEARRPSGDPLRTAEQIAATLDGRSTEHSVEEARYRLALLAMDRDLDLAAGPEQRTSFIVANGTVIDALEDLGRAGGPAADVADKALADYLGGLGKVAATPADYRAVADDPIGIMLFDEVRDPKLRQFYLTANANSKHQDWLKAVIAESVQPSGQDGSPFRLTSFAKLEKEDDAPEPLSVGDVVRVAHDNHPLFQQTFFDDFELPEEDRRPTSVVVELFREHGPLIRLATGPKGNVPRSEILDVLFANDDFLERWSIEQGDTEEARLALVAHLADVQKSKPGVWREARFSPLALQLDEKAGRHADAVLDKYGPDDIATLLLGGYEDSVAVAAEAVDRYGDLAIVILQTYADEAGGGNGIFHRALQNPKVGSRIVPYIAVKGEQALTDVQSDVRWLDKHFHSDGTPRDEVVWYEAAPFVGAPAKVAANWVNGHPSTWEELGWAAVDVADSALLVATFGASAAKAPVQQAAKQAAKQGLKQGAKAAAIRGGKSVAAAGTRESARQARKQIGKSLLRSATAVRLTGVPVVAAGRAMSAAWKALEYVLTRAYQACAAVVRNANEIRKTWARVPPTIRRAVYGGLLAASLYVRIRDRTIPNLHLVGAELGRFVGKTASAFGQTVAAMVAAAVDEILGERMRTFTGWVAYLTACCAAFSVAWRAQPWAKRRVVYG